ncbi:MAG: ABC transporter ATP-binding protein [Verrucomicrobia bacterium]|nr:ABC transporter ATP-binding protein [Verrucomicrobiota bacterium]MCH8528860.1 ABC transporter ATP-binding protein [Kiritimatiellia bacterium]
MSDNAPLLEARNLEKSYEMPKGRVEVLKGVSMRIEAGEQVCIMGASGAGKSTLLHLLGGLDTPGAGEMFAEGQPFHAWPESRRSAFRARRIGIVFQSYHLMPDLNVLENVLMPVRALRRWGSPGPRARGEARRLLERVGLGHRLTHRPMELSGGEQQRVAIARALINDPDILLADEPTGNLDADTGNRVLDDLFALSRERKRCLVIVTHDPALASRCQRVVYLEDGRMVSSKTHLPFANETAIAHSAEIPTDDT